MDHLEAHRASFTGIIYQGLAVCGNVSGHTYHYCAAADNVGAPHLGMGHPTGVPADLPELFRDRLGDDLELPSAGAGAQELGIDAQAAIVAVLFDGADASGGLDDAREHARDYALLCCGAGQGRDAPVLVDGLQVDHLQGERGGHVQRLGQTE